MSRPEAGPQTRHSTLFIRHSRRGGRTTILVVRGGGGGTSWKLVLQTGRIVHKLQMSRNVTNENENINGQIWRQLHFYLCFWTIVDNGGLWTMRAARRWWGEPSGRAVRSGKRQGKRLAGDGSPHQGNAAAVTSDE